MNPFVSILDHIGHGLKVAVTNPVATKLEDIGLSVASVEVPGLSNLFTGIHSALTTAHTLTAQVDGLQGLSAPQKTALAVAIAQSSFDTYQQVTGAKIETDQQHTIVSAFESLLASIPAAVPAQVAAEASVPAQGEAPAPAQGEAAAVPAQVAAEVPAVNPQIVAANAAPLSGQSHPAVTSNLGNH